MQTLTINPFCDIIILYNKKAMKETLAGNPADPQKLTEAERMIKEIEAKGGKSTTNDPGIELGEDLDQETINYLKEINDTPLGRKLG